VLYTTLVVALAGNALLLFSMYRFDQRWDESVAFLLAPLFLYSLLQIPLWAFRTYRGWVIRSPWNPPGETPMHFRFSVAHLLGWSLFLSLPLCIARALEVRADTGGLLFAVLIGLLGCGLLLWYVWMVLYRERLRWWRLIAAAGLAIPCLMLIELILGRTLSDSSEPTGDELIALALMNAAGCFMIGGCLLLARALGYRLHRRADLGLQISSRQAAV
jgi:hypothetical protein